MLRRSTVRYALALLAGVIALSASACGPESPSDVVEELMSMAQAGEIDHAMSLMAPAAFQGWGGETRIRGGMQELGDALNGGVVESIEIVDEEVRGENATVTLHTHYSDGRIDIEELHLTRLGGDWRISDVGQGAESPADVAGSPGDAQKSREDARARAFRSSIVSDLRHMQTLQEQHYFDTDYTYADDITNLNFTTSDGVSINIADASGEGYIATGSHSGWDHSCILTVSSSPSSHIECTDDPDAE